MYMCMPMCLYIHSLLNKVIPFVTMVTQRAINTKQEQQMETTTKTLNPHCFLGNLPYS